MTRMGADEGCQFYEVRALRGCYLVCQLSRRLLVKVSWAVMGTGSVEV